MWRDRLAAGTAEERVADPSWNGRWGWIGRRLGGSEAGCPRRIRGWPWWAESGPVSGRVAENWDGAETWSEKPLGSRTESGRHACWRKEADDTETDRDQREQRRRQSAQTNVGSDAKVWRENGDVEIEQTRRHAPNLPGNRRGRSDRSAGSRGDDRRSRIRGGAEELGWVAWTRRRGREYRGRQWEWNPTVAAADGKEKSREQRWVGYMQKKWPSNPAGTTTTLGWGSRV